MPGVVLEEQDCDGVDLAFAGECGTTISWSDAGTGFAMAAPTSIQSDTAFPFSVPCRS